MPRRYSSRRQDQCEPVRSQKQREFLTIGFAIATTTTSSTNTVVVSYCCSRRQRRRRRRVRQIVSLWCRRFGGTRPYYVCIIVVTFLSRTSDIQRPGRALITAQALGAVALGAAGFGVAFPVFVGLIVVWGALGGVAMSMSRTIVQERAPAASRARVMSFYTLSLMGAGPIGALVNGYLAAWIGPRGTLIAVSGITLLAMITVAFTSHLWRLKSGQRGA